MVAEAAHVCFAANRMGARQLAAEAEVTNFTAAEKMLRNKKTLISRLNGEIKQVRFDAEGKVEQIQSRIRMAQSIIEHLERGTLKP